jgi:hypothetical protein
MKRLLVLLIFVAGGLAAAALSVPTNAATVNVDGIGATISQDQLNSDLTTIAQDADYSCFLKAEVLVDSSGQSMLPAIAGAGHSTDADHNPTINATFASNFLQQEIDEQIFRSVAATRHLVPTSQDLEAARTKVSAEITEVLGQVNGSQYQCGNGTNSLTGNDVLNGLPPSFVKNLVNYNATQSLLAEVLSGVGTSTADMQKFFAANRSQFDTVCYSVAEYSSASDAQAAVAKVTSGTSFATVASQAEQGGPQGCDVLYNITSDVPTGTNLQSLALNTVSAPITLGSNYVLLEFTSRTPTPYATAKSEVQAAVVAEGISKVNSVVGVAVRQASVSVDPRYGTWNKNDVVANPLVPSKLDVLNPLVNTPPVAKAAAVATPATGQSG